MTYKAIIFDLDGTLVNSIADIADAMNVVLAERNYPIYDYKTYKTFVGSGVKSLVIKALPDMAHKQSEIDECLLNMMQVYSKNCTNKTMPYDGILELLDTLNKKEIKLSVLSNKVDSLTKKVSKALLPEYLSPVLGLKEEALKKPNPKVALHICKELNVNPEETIFVGDTNADIQTAINANMKAIGVSWGFRHKKELLESGAEFILEKPLDLLKLL
ncbi:HAD family hydrolase [uncultured Algibacter sp.]|uniref:HAD family hydrolase n=1 Tax=uncultured Algibacter sp. TaxID=298659 RepID=UPI002622EC56|nr:HAD family hydrolase [uncultured Algibacter sp.]